MTALDAAVIVHPKYSTRRGADELHRSERMFTRGEPDRNVRVRIAPTGGVPLLPPPGAHSKLALVTHRIHEKPGTVTLEYATALEGRLRTHDDSPRVATSSAPS